MANQVRLKRITTTKAAFQEWEDYTPAPGEATVIHYIDTQQTELKIGNGVSTIKELPYIQTSSPVPVTDYEKYVCADCGHLCKVNKNKVYAAVCGAGRALGYVCAPSLLQLTVKDCVDLTSDVTVYKKNRDLLYNALTEYGYVAAKPDGAFYLFIKSPEKDANAFCERAKKYELLLVPSDSFGYEGYVRISYCVSTEQIEKSLPYFKALIEEYK